MAEYRNPYQWNDQVVEWDPNAPRQSPWGVTFEQVNPGYISSLLSLRDRVQSGQASADERAQYAAQEAAARAIPMRDPASLQFGWNSDEVGSWNEGGSGWWQMINGSSPDLGPVMLSIRDRMDRGQATPQERQLYEQTLAYDRDWNVRASLPQASDAFSPFGDNLFQALGILGLGATGGLAAAPLFAGGAGLATTLGSLGTLSGLAGTGAGILGGATGQEWLSKAGLGLGALGGILGGVGGLANLWGTGVQSLSDAAKLAQSAGKITGALGSASGNEGLRQASRYLGQAGQLGQFGAGVLPTSFTDWSGDNAPWAANGAPGVAGVSNLLSAADMATQRGGSGMEWDYSNDWGASAPYDDWSWTAGASSPSDYFQSPAYQQFTGWGGDETQQGWYQTADLDTSGSGNWLDTVLGGLGSVGKFLGSNASWLGPAASALGSLGAGALGSRASGDAAALQAAALNRGIDLQTAQWLQQQANQAPWMQAGREALPQLQQLAAQGQQAPFQPPGTLSGWDYYVPPGTPGWSPQMFQGPQALNAGDYRYSAPATVNPAQYAWNPQAAMDPSQYAFNTPGGQELLARDPGYQFRQEEARKALEASAAARGGLTSGATLSALQRQSQDLASQEYGQAYQRALGENQLRYGRGLTQSQEDYQRQLQANQLGYGRATEQQQRGFEQGLGAAGFNWQSALQGQQTGYNQALQSAQWNQGQQQAYDQDRFQREMQYSNTLYGRDLARNQSDYERALAAYNSQLQQQNTGWNRYAALAGLGQTAVGQLGTQGQSNATQMASLLSQLGNAQAGGSLGSGQSWMSALGNVGNAVQGGLANQQLLSVLSGLNR